MEEVCWSRRQESNLYLPLRRRPFYPLNYGEQVARDDREAARSLRPRVKRPARAAYSFIRLERAMPTLEGSHTPGHGGAAVRYRVEYETTGNVVHYKATFSGGSGPRAHEGQFDFDPSKADAAAAVDAFMQNHIAKSDFDVAP